jgi:glycosyltransferase WbpL
VTAASVALAAASLVAVLALTGLVRRYALARLLIDYPNERSSHRVPTPRGGGLAIVSIILAGIAVLLLAGGIPPATAAALGGGGALVGAVGFRDDRRGVSARVRFGVHLLAAAWAVWWLGGMTELTIGTSVVHVGWAGTLLAVATIVWATNLYNFMDGIDGLAAGEAASVGLFAALLLHRAGSPLAAVALLVAGASAGFLPWSWSPARIFMGDVGSCFLGFVFAVLALASENARQLPALAWLILMGVFFADATVTLVRRMLRGERWYAAHRTHAYQRAVQAGMTHHRVTLVVVALNVGLAAIVWLSMKRPALLMPAVGVTAVLLALVYLQVERHNPMPSPAGKATHHDIAS